MNAPDSGPSLKAPASTGVTAAPANADGRAGLFAVVGVGASAGGLEAFAQLLAHLPEKTGMAFVLVQHLDAAQDSHLTELLSKSTRLPVHEATAGMAVSPDGVYVIPPNTNMAIVGGILQLTPRADATGPHRPLDFFFRSLAADRSSRAIGVLLSGNGSDGSIGLAEIKAAGGLTFAQDEKSAHFPAMPLNAIKNGCVDYILRPDEIAHELARIGRHPYLSAAPAARGAPDSSPQADDVFHSILALLRAATGVDFRQYRDTTIKRRIGRRMVLQKKEAWTDYLRFLEASPPELSALYRDILISVTSFFRDPDVFDAIKTTIFPEIIKDKSSEVPIRIWIPGCSTGQEAYSLAMVLLEFLDDQPVRPPVQIFGTDVNDMAAIEKARLGLYPYSIESEISPERLRRFFTREVSGYRIAKPIRDMCVFARQNVVGDPPFSKLDLISCRNLLIYLSEALQKRVIPTFHYALNPGGFLVLGTAESVGRFSDLFSLKHSNIYVKLPGLTRTRPHIVADDRPPKATGLAVGLGERAPQVSDMQREADRIILGQYAPPAVLINEDLEILQFRGATRPYLEPAQGQASLNILKMARDTLFVELRNVIDEAKQQNVTARRPGVRVRDEQQARLVNLEVRPIRLSGSTQRCFLVLFHEVSAPIAPAPGLTASPGASPAAAPPAPDDQVVQQLRQELGSAKEYLQAIIEQQTAANEELQSANEEILSSNEELQSTNEELQTTKAELQSTNEELRSLNAELQERNREISQANDDLTNTFSSIKMPIVLLDSELRIRQFTPTAKVGLHLIPADVGRPLGDLRPSFDIPELESMLLDVIATVAPREREIQDRTGRWYVLGMHPYRTADNRIDGVVLALIDIDERHRAQEQLKKAKEAAESADRAKDRFLAVLSHELRTPLTPVLAAVSMMQKEATLPQEVLANLGMIHRNIELEAALIEDLLDLTRVAKGKLNLHVQTLDLRALLHRTVETCGAEIEANGLHLTVDVDTGPHCIRGDPARLEQVFWNLLRNAIKFTPRGGSITMRCSNGSGYGSRIPGTDCSPVGSEGFCPDIPNTERDIRSAVVEVIDNGMGIEPEQIGRLFEAFEQGDPAVTRKFGGLGLGLAICKSLIEMHGGTIAAISSGRGLGATFRVELPVCSLQLAACECATGGARRQATPVAIGRLRKLQLLLVEDHADTARVMAQLLQKQGHTVKVAGGVAAALNLAQQHPFDVVISDLGLPDGSGHDLMRQLRANQCKAKGIALSGYGMEEDMRKSREAGFVEHLTKPVDIERLQAAIGRVAKA